LLFAFCFLLFAFCFLLFVLRSLTPRTHGRVMDALARPHNAFLCGCLATADRLSASLSFCSFALLLFCSFARLLVCSFARLLVCSRSIIGWRVSWTASPCSYSCSSRLFRTFGSPSGGRQRLRCMDPAATGGWRSFSCPI
jgi:hypothetical protein